MINLFFFFSLIGAIFIVLYSVIFSCTLFVVIMVAPSSPPPLFRNLICKVESEQKYYFFGRSMSTQNVLGPSTAKSEYHCATLVGPWEEERRQFGMGVTSQLRDVSLPIDTNTTYKDSYLSLTPEQVAGAKPPGCFAAEAPHQLLFYHGDLLHPVKSQIPMTELSWSDRKVNPHTTPELYDTMGISKRRDATNRIGATNGQGMGGEDGISSNAVERETAFLRTLQTGGGKLTGVSQGEAGGYKPKPLPPIGRVAERNRLLTTKQVTIDSTGLYLKSHRESYPLTSSDCVRTFTKSLDNVMNKTELRIEYEDQ